MKNYLKIVKINHYAPVPVYRQVANAIIQGIASGSIVKDDILPSIRDLYIALDISRKSVEKAYNTLKAEGVVISVKGKGFFVADAIEHHA